MDAVYRTLQGTGGKEVEDVVVGPHSGSGWASTSTVRQKATRDHRAIMVDEEVREI